MIKPQLGAAFAATEKSVEETLASIHMLFRGGYAGRLHEAVRPIEGEAEPAIGPDSFPLRDPGDAVDLVRRAGGAFFGYALFIDAITYDVTVASVVNSQGGHGMRLMFERRFTDGFFRRSSLRRIVYDLCAKLMLRTGAPFCVLGQELGLGVATLGDAGSLHQIEEVLGPRARVYALLAPESAINEGLFAWAHMAARHEATLPEEPVNVFELVDFEGLGRAFG